MRRTTAACLLAALLCPVAASGAPTLAPLRFLPAAKVKGLGPLLRSQDVALLESNDQGLQRQITSLTFCAAPVELVRQVVSQPEHYQEFVRNMKESAVQRRPDGTLDHTYTISYTVEKIVGRHRYIFLPAGPDGAGAPPIEMYDPDDNGNRHYRWEFTPALGGTIMALYGYTHIPSSGVMDRLMSRVPTLEMGLALITQMTWLLAMKARAEQLAGPLALPSLAAAPPPQSYAFMLERGMVALFRSREGRIAEISMIDRVRALPETVLRIAADPARWSQFVPSFTRSNDLGPQADGISRVELEQSLPLMSFRTIYGVRRGPAAVDMLGLEGDLRGGRMRWDVRPGQGGMAQLVLRTNQAFDRASTIIRQLYKLEPLFEYGVDVGLQLVILRGVKARAEQLGARG